MSEKEPVAILKTHTLRIPYSFIVFGKTFEMPLECVFGYSGDLVNNHNVEILSLTSKNEEGLMFDMSYLIEDEEDALTTHIISCIVSNSSHWNHDTSWWS